MAHMWDRGVLNTSSWHGLEDIGIFTDAASAIRHGEECGAYPVKLFSTDLYTAQGVKAEGFFSQVAQYLNSETHPDRVVGINRERYRATTPEEWRNLIKAVCDAGGKPTGAFSLRDGTRVLATFEIGGEDEESSKITGAIKNQLLLVDSFDGTCHLTAGRTSTRVVCANTLSIAMRNDGSEMAKLRHTASLEERVKLLQKSIADSIKEGDKVVELFKRACNTTLNKLEAFKAFDALFPEAAEDASQNAQTRAKNDRDDGWKAAVMPINRVGTRGNAGTIWNAATYLIDRNADGSARKVKGAPEGQSSASLESMVFGTRGKQVQEVYQVMETFLDETLPEMRAQANARPVVAVSASLEKPATPILDSLLDS